MGTIKRTFVKDAYPELELWFMDKEVFNTCCVGSTKEANFKCPNCGNIETIKICLFIKRVNKCLNCKQDGISRPNKFLREFLKQIEPQVDFRETEWNPDWAEKYLYDGHIIINNIDYIIEMHGEQHYRQTGKWDFKYQRERDINKQKLADKNGVEQIIINCTKTDLHSLKNEIIKSRLSELVDLTKIDWYSIFKNCSNNYIKVASDLYNEGLTINSIANEMMFERHTISRFLLDGNELHWCNYNPISCTEMYKKDIKITNIKTQQKIIIHGVQEAANFIEQDSGFKIDRHTIKDYCNGYRIEYYGGKHICSLEGVLYKDTYLFERIS